MGDGGLAVGIAVSASVGDAGCTEGDAPSIVGVTTAAVGDGTAVAAAVAAIAAGADAATRGSAEDGWPQAVRATEAAHVQQTISMTLFGQRPGRRYIPE